MNKLFRKGKAMKSKIILKLDARQCPNCQDVIFSRANHDFRSCSCGDISVDGGFSSYGGRVLWKDKLPEHKIVEVTQTQKELYEDWNYHIDKYGIIKGKDYIKNNK